MIKDSMIRRFNNKGEAPVYDPIEFEILCLEAGATSLFSNLQATICTARQSADRIKLNRKIVVLSIYQLCYGLSQRCNAIRKDNMLFKISENINKEAVNTERRLGLSCSSQTAYRHLRKVEQT